MNKSQRIYLSTGTTETNKYIQVKLEQDVDTIEFMSMSIYTKDAYQDFNADYGVLVGRVIANGGVGIPNAKISIFIPLSDADAQIGDIASIYPYKTPRDKNAQGKRYNLLPRVSEYDPATGIYSPKQPFGSFPIKPEIVTNQSFLDVYKKYYKYTALTNNAGDYMIFGVPVGLQTVHLSVDITDIGKYSMSPASMVTNLGYSANLFYDNNSKIKPSDDLNDLPNIETQEISVDIMPFWGDTTNFTIGITRQDFRIRSVLINTFVVFGSAFTDGSNSMWGEDSDGGAVRIRELYHIRNTDEPETNFNVSMKSKRISKITEKIYYYPAAITDDMITGGTVNPITDMVLLDPTQYSVYKRDGDFAFIISCNRNKIITDEFGKEISVSNTSTNGIFTKFRGFITLEITEDDAPMDFSTNIGKGARIKPYRHKIKIPQFAEKGYSFEEPNGSYEGENTQNWRKQHYIFTGGTLYSIANFNATVSNTEYNDYDQGGGQFGFLRHDEINSPFNSGTPNRDFNFQTGIILTNDYNISGNTNYDMPPNSLDTGGAKFFGANWLNFTLYLPQFSYVDTGYNLTRYIRTTTNFNRQIFDFQTTDYNSYFLYDNTQNIAARQLNTKWFARSDIHWTDFIAVPKTDIITINGFIPKGFTSNVIGLTGKYRNGWYTPPTGGWTAPCPFNGGKQDGNPDNPDRSDLKTYFYKGFNTANCIEFITSLGLV